MRPLSRKFDEVREAMALDRCAMAAAPRGLFECCTRSILRAAVESNWDLGGEARDEAPEGDILGESKERARVGE